MNEKDLIRLSELLDHGDSSSAEALELLRDPGLAERFHQYQGLRRQLRELDEPAANPAFVTRVMATVRETPVAAPFWRSWRVLAPLTAAACLVLVSGAYYFSAPPGELSDPMIAQLLTMDDRELDSFTMDLASQIPATSGPTRRSFVTFTSAPGNLEFGGDVDPVQVASIQEDLWFRLATELDKSADLALVLEYFTPEEAEAFRLMLVRYAEEGFIS